MVDIALNCAIIVKYILLSRLPSNSQSIASRPDIRETTIALPYHNNSTHRPFQNPSDVRAFFAPTLFSSMRMTCICAVIALTTKQEFSLQRRKTFLEVAFFPLFSL
jgi:hypothetical protein